MCVPQTLAAFQALSTVSQSLTKGHSEAKYEKAVAKNNQILAEQNAKEQRRQGSIKAKQQQLQASQRGAQLRNRLAASGVQTTTGTALNMAQDIAEQGEIQAHETLRNAEQKARKNDSAAQTYKEQQRASKWDLGKALYNTGDTFLSNRNIFGKRGLLCF